MGDGGAARRERRARRDAERRAQEDARRFERQMKETEAKNKERLAQIQAQNQKQQAALEQTMQANVAELSRAPTTIRRKKRTRRGQGGVGRDRLRIAMEQKGSSTNLG
tara:strand:+ start:164 stop:487 length:324 start_codon:yes stop_codon:yes gene_type:complete